MSINIPPLKSQIVDNRGFATRYFRDFLYMLWERTGGIDGDPGIPERLLSSGLNVGNRNETDINFIPSRQAADHQQNEIIQFKTELANESTVQLPSIDGIPSAVIVKKLQLFRNYGGLYVTENTTPEATVDTTPRKITAFDTAMPTGSRAVSSASSNSVTITNKGYYLLSAQISFLGDAEDGYSFEFAVDGVPTGLQCNQQAQKQSSDINSVSVSGIVDLDDGAAITLLQSSTKATTLTVYNSQLVVTRIN